MGLKSSKPVPPRLLLLGLDSGGKTTFLYKSKFGEVVTTIPTIGFNVETVETKDVSLTVFDLGGRCKIRPLWRYYYQGTDAVIWMVDAASDYHLSEDAKKELWRLLVADHYEDGLKGVPFAICANKQDLPQALDAKGVRDFFGLTDEALERAGVDTNRIAIFETCALTNAGFSEVFKWLESVAKPLREDTSKLVVAPSKKVDEDAILSAIEQRRAVLDAVERRPRTPLEWVLSTLTLLQSVGSCVLTLSDEAFLQQWKAELDLAEAGPQDAQSEEGSRRFKEESLVYSHAGSLRLLWLVLRKQMETDAWREKEGRTAVVTSIMNEMQTAAKGNSRICRVFHMTHVYFWIQMVDIALHLKKSKSDKVEDELRLYAKDKDEFTQQSCGDLAKLLDNNSDSQSFTQFLFTHPWLMDDGLHQDYYTSTLFLHDPKAMESFVMPDKQPLPSIVSFNVPSTIKVHTVDKASLGVKS